MTFDSPQVLWWLLLGIPLVVAWRLRPERERWTVATASLWKAALAEQRVRRPWRRWRSPASLVIALAVLALLVGAAAGPSVPPPRIWLGTAAVLLVLEWWWFHRRWIW